MKPNNVASTVCLVITVLIFALTGSASAATLSLSPSKTFLTPGESFSVDIVVDDARDIVGCTLTVNYPQAFLNPANPAASTTFFQLFQDSRQGASPSEIDPWMENSNYTGKILLAGVYVDPVTGLGKFTGQQTLFTLTFQVDSGAMGGPIFITLSRTQLCNESAGWGTDTNGNGQCDAGDTPEGAPILIKAVDIGTGNDFETALESFTTDPLQMFRIVTAGTDSDGDGISDVDEDSCGNCLDKNNPDSDGDGLWDGVEDANADCFVDADETDPCDPDTDSDGVKDGDEDTNKNGIWENGELKPLESDTDGDTYTDGFEKYLGTDPSDGNSSPEIICIGDTCSSDPDCDVCEPTVTAGKANRWLDAEFYYFWIRDQLLGDESITIDSNMLIEIKTGPLTIQPTSP